uniref:Uncharacterized protein ycf23 n=1 Tax=Renouxia sp. TaxID=2485823 RepID=A0A3G3MHM6_9FLOR|nr:hypothetical protein [Renouxia sp.]
MTLFNSQLDKATKERNLVKVITGLDNFNIHTIVQMVKAAETAGATYVDIAANNSIVREIKKHTNLPVCVSSIDPEELYDVSLEGVDIIEIGNFDCLYSKNITFSKSQILDLAKEVINLFPFTDICVTIPHILSLSEQVQLSSELEEVGVKILQTEGYYTKIVEPSSQFQREVGQLADLINYASSTLTSTYMISKVVKIPVIAASGINVLSAPLSILYGASGVGIGKAIKNNKTSLGMAKYIREVIDSVKQNEINSLNHIPALVRISNSFNSSVSF